MSENDDECPECSNMSSCCGYGEDSALAAAQERIAQLEQERDRWQLRFAGNDRLMLKAQERIRVLATLAQEMLDGEKACQDWGNSDPGDEDEPPWCTCDARRERLAEAVRAALGKEG